MLFSEFSIKKKNYKDKFLKLISSAYYSIMNAIEWISITFPNCTKWSASHIFALEIVWNSTGRALLIDI